MQLPRPDKACRHAGGKGRRDRSATNRLREPRVDPNAHAYEQASRRGSLKSGATLLTTVGRADVVVELFCAIRDARSTSEERAARMEALGVTQQELGAALKSQIPQPPDEFKGVLARLALTPRQAM